VRGERKAYTLNTQCNLGGWLVVHVCMLFVAFLVSVDSLQTHLRLAPRYAVLVLPLRALDCSAAYWMARKVYVIFTALRFAVQVNTEHCTRRLVQLCKRGKWGGEDLEKWRTKGVEGPSKIFVWTGLLLVLQQRETSRLSDICLSLIAE